MQIRGAIRNDNEYMIMNNATISTTQYFAKALRAEKEFQNRMHYRIRIEIEKVGGVALSQRCHFLCQNKSIKHWE